MERILVVGGGSIGMLLAAKLARLGKATVTLAVRTEEQAVLIRTRGILLEEEGRIANVLVSAKTWTDSGLADGSWDWILLCVKQTQITDELIDRAKSWASGQTGILCVQNGLGHEELLGERIGNADLWCAVTTEAALKTEPNRVIHTGSGTTVIGRIEDRHSTTPKDEKNLLGLMAQAGFSNSVSNNIRDVMWHKVVVNAVINPLTAAYGVRNGRLPAHPERLALMRLLFDEAAEAAKRAGYPLDPGHWERLLSICRATSNNESSMLQDVRWGRPTEIDYINGSIIREANRHGLRLVAHETILRLVKGIETVRE